MVGEIVAGLLLGPSFLMDRTGALYARLPLFPAAEFVGLEQS